MAPLLETETLLFCFVYTLKVNKAKLKLLQKHCQGSLYFSFQLTLPPWPIYRRNPLKWLPVQESAIDDKKPADRKVKRHTKN